MACVGNIAGVPPQLSVNLCGEQFQFWASVTDSFGNFFYAAGDRIFALRQDNTCGGITGGPPGGFAGDGGPAELALLSAPHDLALDAATNDLIIADTLNNRVRRIVHDSGLIFSIAGNGNSTCESPDGIPATSACVFFPAGVVVDGAGNVLIGEAGSNRVRILYSGNGTIGSIAGQGTRGFCGDGGPAAGACFWSGYEPTVFHAELYVFALKLAIDSMGGIVIGDFGNNRVRRIATNGIITTLAGTGGRTSSGDGGPASLAAIGMPTGLMVDRDDGGILIAEYANSRVRRVALDGEISTRFGNGLPAQGCSTDGPTLSTCLYYPYGLSLDPRGGVTVASQRFFNLSITSNELGVLVDIFNDTARRILRPADGSGQGCVRVLGEPATLQCLKDASYPAIDADGNVHFSYYGFSQVFSVRAVDGRLVLTAGVGGKGFSGDGGPATSAALNRPETIAIDAPRGLL
jgi:trimeric autotransporter adhesin